VSYVLTIILNTVDHYTDRDHYLTLYNDQSFKMRFISPTL